MQKSSCMLIFFEMLLISHHLLLKKKKSVFVFYLSPCKKSKAVPSLTFTCGGVAELIWPSLPQWQRGSKKTLTDRKCGEIRRHRKKRVHLFLLCHRTASHSPLPQTLMESWNWASWCKLSHSQCYTQSQSVTLQKLLLVQLLSIFPHHHHLLRLSSYLKPSFPLKAPHSLDSRSIFRKEYLSLLKLIPQIS